MTNAFDRTVQAWAKEKLESLDPRIRFLIREANLDLYCGPSHGEDSEHEWPGFQSATREIAGALDIGDVWIDDNSESWTESEPEDVDLYWHVGRAEAIRALVGKELATYVT